MKNVLILQHTTCEGPGSLRDLLRRRGACAQICRVDLEPALPPITWDLIVILGGPMNVDEEAAHPWLVAEKNFLRQAIARDIPLLGICLGAQLLAECLGAAVTRNQEREIGWFDITRTAEAATHPLGRLWPERCEVFHWHGDTFTLPKGAVRLASSAACANQAFIFGTRILGLQFHPEMTPESGEEIRAGCFQDLVNPGPYVQDQKTIAASPDRFLRLRATMETLLHPWLDLIGWA